MNQEKRLAAERSLEYVRDGMCLGLGSGSTAAIMLELLGQRVRDGTARPRRPDVGDQPAAGRTRRDPDRQFRRGFLSGSRD